MDERAPYLPKLATQLACSCGSLIGPHSLRRLISSQSCRLSSCGCAFSCNVRVNDLNQLPWASPYRQQFFLVYRVRESTNSRRSRVRSRPEPPLMASRRSAAKRISSRDDRHLRRPPPLRSLATKLAVPLRRHRSILLSPDRRPRRLPRQHPQLSFGPGRPL